ncbi:MAG: Fe-S cluster assembly ATPase SufC [Nanoarchaeota archaeon]
MDELVVKAIHGGIDGKEILKGVNLHIKKGEVVAVMGPNGSGKTTLANVIMGHPKYVITKGDILWKKKSILGMNASERSTAGIFLSFQHPEEVQGVTIASFLRTAYNIRQKKHLSVMDFYKLLQEKMQLLGIPDSFKSRYLNAGFSGGEKKRSEILQLVLLSPEIAILDETDSGTDVDALRIIGEGINKIKAETGMGVLLITHYERILRYVKPDRVLIMREGKIVKEGGFDLALEIEKNGYG